MIETKYLVDNNAIVAIRSHRVRSEFFATYCQVTDDVLWEADGHPELAALKRSVAEFTPEVLEQVRAVMKTVEVGDTSLVDLYGNKGSADPGLIASALAAIQADEGMFFGDTWVLVTNDNAVEDKAAQFGVATIKPAELAELIDSLR